LAGPETIAVSFASPLAEELAEDVLERFLRYARIDTQGAYRVPERPSTQKQLELSRLLVGELRELLALESAELRWIVDGLEQLVHRRIVAIAPQFAGRGAHA